MKKITIVLAMLLIAATSYNQSSRRTTNRATTAQRAETRSGDASANHATQARNIHQSNSRQTTSTVHQSGTATPNTRNNQRSATNSTYPGNNTRVTRTNAQQTNTHGTSNAASRERSNTVNTAPRRVTSSTHVRTSGTSGRVYVSSRQYTGRHAGVHQYHAPPPSRAYRARHYEYRAPVSLNIIWTPVMHSHYIRMYPMVKYWHYRHGYHIANVSAYFAEYYMGDVMTVYGRVSEVYYSRSTDEYFLYYGAYYPYQDFTTVIPGWIARQYSKWPERYFRNQHIAATGLITSFQGEPEIVVKESFQLNLY